MMPITSRRSASAAIVVVLPPQGPPDMQTKNINASMNARMRCSDTVKQKHYLQKLS